MSDFKPPPEIVLITAARLTGQPEQRVWSDLTSWLILQCGMDWLSDLAPGTRFVRAGRVFYRVDVPDSHPDCFGGVDEEHNVEIWTADHLVLPLPEPPTEPPTVGRRVAGTCENCGRDAELMPGGYHICAECAGAEDHE